VEGFLGNTIVQDSPQKQILKKWVDKGKPFGYTNTIAADNIYIYRA